MKKRHSFVSNSSSSSFVIIDAEEGHEPLPCEGSEVAFGQMGETEFGWGPSTLRDMHSRINFAYLQAIYAQDDEYLVMLNEVVEEHIGKDLSIKWLISTDWDDKKRPRDHVWGYIDHQSSAVEGENMEIFDSKEKLKDFLFGKGSYIELDNDNRY